jgi:hypothetical protein
LSATEPQRLALHAAARAALGAEEGDTLMALTPPANTEMATMQALERVEERLGARIDKVELRMRVFTFVTVLAVQGVATGYLTSVLR